MIECSVKKCTAQSFLLPAYHKGKYFIGCNYYGEIVISDKCEKCKTKRFFGETENALKDGDE